MSGEAVVTGLAIAPVKGMRLREVERISLELTGVRENRRFYWIDGRDRMVNGKVVGELQQVVADYSDATRRLKLILPDGTVIEDEVRPGEPTTTRFFSHTSEGRLVDGPWAAAVSAHLGREVRLVEAGEAGAVDRGDGATVSVISRASLGRLAQVAGENGDLDVRRFRMLIEVDGVAAHAEDDWVGRTVRIGGARIEFCGHVGRCLITSRDPETGSIDLPTLDLLGSYRSGLATSEPLPFGIHGRPVAAGQVAVGDPVVVEG
jgi:uncharacterized protein